MTTTIDAGMMERVHEYAERRGNEVIFTGSEEVLRKDATPEQIAQYNELVSFDKGVLLMEQINSKVVKNLG